MTVIRCKHCTRSFSTPSRYQNHLRLAHGEGDDDEADDEPEVDAGPHLAVVDERPTIRWEDPPFGRPDITSPLVDAIDPAAHGLAGGWRLTDAEDRDEAEVTASPGLIDQYRANLGGWCANLRDFAVRRSIMHLVVDTQTEVDTLLLEYLRRRGLLR